MSSAPLVLLSRALIFSLGLATTVCQTSCQSSSKKKTAAAAAVRSAAQPERAFWRGDGVSGARRMVVDLSKQELRYYKGDQLVGLSPIASGTRSHPTPTGSFRVMEKDLHHRSSCYGDYVYPDGTVAAGDIDCRKDAKPAGSRYLGASMRWFMRINGPVGMHEGWLPGLPASHGCIRLPTQMAEIFFRETPVGTPVQVVGSGSHAVPEREVAIGDDILGRYPAVVVSGGPDRKKASRQSSSEAASRKPGRPGEVVKLDSSQRRRGQTPPPARGQTLYLYTD